jgi:hypothetical protein
MNGQNIDRRSLEINLIEEEAKGKERELLKYGALKIMQLQEAAVFVCAPETTRYAMVGVFFVLFILLVGGGIKVHSTLRPLNGLLCQPRVIMIMEKSVE